MSDDSLKAEVKTFIEALQNYHSEPKKVKKCLSSHQLTSPEKKIIECWLHFQDQQFNKILSILDALSSTYSPLIEAQKYLILGITLNHKHEFAQAIPLILKAYTVIRAYSLPKQQVLAIENLFIAYQHEQDKDGMRYCLDEVNEMSDTFTHRSLRKKAA